MNGNRSVSKKLGNKKSAARNRKPKTDEKLRAGNKEEEISQYDVVIIGGGPGGYAAALYGAGAGLKVALIEENKLGGTCLNVGCIPAKELLESAAVYRAVAGAGRLGINVGQPDPTFDLSVMMTRKQEVIERLLSGLSALLGHRKVTIYNGTGVLCGRGVVQVTDGVESQTLSASSVILATGSKPRTIPGFEVDGELVVTSDEVLSLKELPRKAVVVGGGAIGCEFASMMADLGVEVTLLEALPGLLGGCDADVVKVLERSFKKRHIKVHTGVAVSGHEPNTGKAAGGTAVYLGEDKKIDVDLVVMAVGRQPYTEGLNLEAAGVETDSRGFVVTDENCRTSVEGVWAVGDVIDTPQLAHVAFVEGMMAIDDIKGDNPVPIDYQGVPWCIYCHPEVAFAGHTEASAIEAGYEVVASSHRHITNGRALIVGETDGLIKVVAEKKADGTGGRILGVHMCGPWVTEQLGQAYLAVNWEATVDDVAALIQPHPTMSELFGEAALELAGRSLHG